MAWETPVFDLLWCDGLASDAELRRLWEGRRGRQAHLVILLAPADDGSRLKVLGPQQARPVRELPREKIVDLLQQARSRAVREAAAFLTGEFQRLEEAVIPGLRVKDLLTPHFLRERLRSPANQNKLLVAVKDLPRTISSGWRDFFRKLGYQIQTLRRGYLLRYDDVPIAVVSPYRDPALFSRLTDNGELPEGMVLADCQKQGAVWGVLAAGSRFRLFQRQPPVGSSTGQYLEIDAEELKQDHRFYLGLLAPAALQEGGWLTGWVREAKDFGEELRKGLEERLIREALPHIACGLGSWLEKGGADLSDREQLQRIEEAALTLVFQFMFLLHTEARGYLPISAASYRPHSARTLAEDCQVAASTLSRRSTQRWDRLRTLVRMVRTGDPSVGVPAYNGSLFAADGFPGSTLLEQAEIADVHLAPALSAIAHDTSKPHASGLDYAGLQIGHLGAIYEKLLSLQLTRAPEDLAYDVKRDVFRLIRAGEQPEVTRAQLYYQSQAGGRKAGGVFYTRHEFVSHLLNHSLAPALDAHLSEMRQLMAQNPAEAGRRLFDFSVVDPAMGSAHFLTAALDVMADRIEVFLAETGGLPGICQQLSELTQDTGPATHQPEDGDLLRRLILKRCIFGVDLSPMAVEVANVTLWLASFVPGLALSYLGSNLKCGDALIGVADPSVVGASDSSLLTGKPVQDAMSRAAKLQQEQAAIPDRTPEEVQHSKELGAKREQATASLCNAFDLWTAEPLGLDGARHTLRIHAGAIASGEIGEVANALTDAQIIVRQYRFFHWLLEFPSIFHRNRPGFDVVVGNPPWNEVTVEELAFYALRDPGLRGLSLYAERKKRIAELDRQNPTWRDEFQAEQQHLSTLRGFFSAAGGYQLQGVGDKDLYQLFCERYSHLVRRKGFVGVVLPRSAFLAEGAKGFRQWLFNNNVLRRLDLLLNKRGWAFSIHPQWTIALLTSQRRVSQVSYQELAQDQQLSRGSQCVLPVNKDVYRLVVIDEAHAYRNADNTWYATLDRLMGGTSKKLLLLTATPVNNSLWDLHNLFLLFGRHDAAFNEKPLRIPSLRKFFVEAGASNAEQLSETRLFPLMDALTVRRDRAFIKKHYPNERFTDGAPVKFPEPQLSEHRYNLDETQPGLVQIIYDGIDSLRMARYRISAYRRDGSGESASEEALAGLMQSQLLKRFESSWWAALQTVKRMHKSNALMLTTIAEHGVILPPKIIKDLVGNWEEDDGFLGGELLDAALAGAESGIPATQFNDQLQVDLQKDLDVLAAMAARLEKLQDQSDPKLMAMAEIMRKTPAKKVAVFTAYQDTANYLKDQIEKRPELLENRSWTAVIGSGSSANVRTQELERFCPESVNDEPGFQPRDGEVDVLLSTDILSEGQNLQQAQAVLSFDMPWNPQRVVQRNGRVIRLRSPHATAYLYTLLPVKGDLDRLLKLEAKLQAKIRAANAAVGTETPVLANTEAESQAYADLNAYVKRLSDGDTTLLDEQSDKGGHSSAFAGELFRSCLRRAAEEGEINRLKELPWGIGAAFVEQPPTLAEPAVFFACRTRHGERYWRMVSQSGEILHRDDLPMLELINPQEQPGISISSNLDLEKLLALAVDDIFKTHNALPEPKRNAPLPASQRWALDILRSPDVPAGKEFNDADEALSVGRNNLVRRELSELRREYKDDGISIADCARRIVRIVADFGLRAIHTSPIPKPVSEEDLGVVCYQVVIPKTL